MNSKYLLSDPAPWLLEHSDASIRYLYKRDILHNEEDEYSLLHKDPVIAGILKKERNGVVGDTRDFDLHYKGTMWYFAELVERGLDNRSMAITNTGCHILENHQLEDGGFTLRWKPRAAVSCRTGDMLRYLIKAGVTHSGIDRGIQWIIDHQRADGGWLHCPLAGYSDFLFFSLFNRSGNFIDREKDPSVTSCIYGSIACLDALNHYHDKCETVKESIARAAEFFLSRKMFKTSDNRVIRPRYGWNRDFRLLGLPVLSQYDILFGLRVIAHAGYIKDARTGEAFNLIMQKQNNDGTWNLESASTGMLVQNKSKGLMGRRNKWVTLNAVRLLHALG